ncbi:MAG: DUF1707 SHOCT-like domain-containing protein [Streptosporangiaceae bacterium]
MAAGSGRGRLRASHADREHVVGTLKAAYVHGLVTKDEFDARVSQTFASRTYAELALITADLPAGLAAAPPPPRPGLAKANPPAHANLTPGERAIMGTGLLAALMILAALLTGGAAGGLMGLGALGSALVSLCLVGAQVRSSRRNRHSGGHLPPQRATHSGPGAGRQAASAPPAEQLPNPGKPQRRSNADTALRHSLNPQLSS